MRTDYLSKVGSDLVKRCGTRDPFRIAHELGIEVLFCDDFGPLKGMYRVIKRNRFVFINKDLSERMQRIVCAHELGHDQLHRHFAKGNMLQEFMLYDMARLSGTLGRKSEWFIMEFNNSEFVEEIMAKEINPKYTTRAMAFELWMQAPNPMVTFFKTIDVTNLIRISKKKHLKFNMLLDYCIGKAAVGVKEFYLLPVGDKLIQYDTIAVNTIVKNRNGEVSSCDILYSNDLNTFNQDYLKYTAQVADSCQDRDLSADSMVIGTSAIVDTEIDGAVGMNSGIFNNPFIIWGRYKKKIFRYYLPISFQFHHTQMDGAHAGRFLANLQKEINELG